MLFLAMAPPAQAAAVTIRIEGDWQIRVTAGTLKIGRTTVRVAKDAVLTVKPATLAQVRNEKHDALPVFQPNAAGWTKGARLNALVTFETTGPDLLVPGTLVVKADEGDGTKYERGRDYDFDDRWGTFGRLTGQIGENQPVWVDYDCGLHRIDSIVVDKAGKVSLVQGKPHNATPAQPDLAVSQTRIANLWISGRLERLTDENLFPITEPAYVAPKVTKPVAETLLPKSWAKLNAGGSLSVLAWGDSVTAGGQASDAAHQYQSQFVTMLKARFPKANITLTTAGWGGRNSDSFLNEPPTSEYNFERAVIQRKPDLIVMEFVNDSGMDPATVETKYSYLLKRFTEIGAEWVIVGPHFVWQEWMGSKTVKIESDPRPYVAGIRAFSKKHNIPLADTGLRYGHLAKEGIPYVTLMCNSLNHPNDFGHEMFALAIMELFGGPAAGK